MGFLDRIRRILLGPDYEKETRNLNNRIYELSEDKKKSDAKLEALKRTEVKIPSFQIKRHSKTNTFEVKQFNPQHLRPIRTMKDLMQLRKEEEAQRRKQLQEQIVKNLDSVRSLIDNENPEQAEDLLFSTSSALQQLGDKQLSSLYEDLLIDIKSVKEELRQREIKRREEEAKQKAAEEAARLEQERIKKLREEEIRIEKARKAREYEEKLAHEEQTRHLEIERLTKLVERKKDDGAEILRYLEMKGIRRFYHFTDKENLYQIKRLGGLYSWYYCDQNDIEIPNAGGDWDSRKYDRRHGLQDYVRLSFCNDHPMAWRKYKEGSSLILLYIDVEVASFKDTLFTDRNAASGSFARGGDMEALQKVNISATQRNYVSRDEGEIFSQHQAECMIKTFLPIKYITNIDNPQKMLF